LNQLLKSGKCTIPRIGLGILAFCVILSSVSASEIPQFCNAVSENTQITLSYLYVGPHYDLGLYIPQNPVHNLPEPLSTGDLRELRNYLKDSGLLPPESDGKTIMFEVRYPDGNTILYKIQPDFSAVEEITVSTVNTYDGVPSDDTLDLYYPIIRSVTSNQDWDPSVLSSRSFNDSSSITGKIQKNTFNPGKIQNQVMDSYLKSSKIQPEFLAVEEITIPNVDISESMLSVDTLDLYYTVTPSVTSDDDGDPSVPSSRSLHDFSSITGKLHTINPGKIQNRATDSYLKSSELFVTAN
jgi:hypothetical protein